MCFYVRTKTLGAASNFDEALNVGLNPVRIDQQGGRENRFGVFGFVPVVLFVHLELFGSDVSGRYAAIYDKGGASGE